MPRIEKSKKQPMRRKIFIERKGGGGRLSVKWETIEMEVPTQNHFKNTMPEARSRKQDA